VSKPYSEVRFSERLFGALQHCLPTRLLSSCVHRLGQARTRWLKNILIRCFVHLYRIDMTTAAEPNPAAYPSFNAFFTRSLRSGLRPIDHRQHRIVAPVDGQLGTFGSTRSGRIFQTKGMAYDLADLLAANRAWTQQFEGGMFATLYLAPANYHRVHMPVDATLRASHYVPGRLFGVNPASVRSIPRLFTRNERVVALFDSSAGPMAMVMIGAFCVGGIETRWSGRVCPPHGRGAGRPLPTPSAANAPHFQRGEEMGRFNLGSSVILLFGPQAMTWNEDLTSGQPLVLGRAIGRQRTAAGC